VIIAFGFVLTIPFSLWLRHAETARRSSSNQFLLDVLVITGWIHFTGGIGSDFCLVYPLVILAAGIVVSGNHAFRVALFVVLVYATLIVLEIGQVLPFPGAPPLLPPAPVVIQTLMMRILFFILFAAAVSYLADLCLYRGRELLRYRDVAKLLFNEVSAPLLAFVPEEMSIVLANDAAAAELGLKNGELAGKKVASFFVDEVPDFHPADQNEAGRGRIRKMRRADGSVFPAVIRISRTRLPVPGIGLTGQLASEFGILAFQNVESVFSSENAERLKSAAGVLAEVVHSVGNPVTALRAAGELLAKTAKVGGLQHDGVSGDWAMIQSLCAVVAEESEKLEEQLRFFLDAATKDPDRLRKFADRGEMWTERLSMTPGDKS